MHDVIRSDNLFKILEISAWQRDLIRDNRDPRSRKMHSTADDSDGADKAGSVKARFSRKKPE
jgi:hypothetical protein